MCHANSLFFASAFAYAGASSCVYDARSFDPELLLRALAHERATFTSLVPTHYIMMLSLPDAVRAGSDVDSVRRLLISSAPARDAKLAILAWFRNAQLLEMYGSTEQGWRQCCAYEGQLTKLGSIGRELIGCRQFRLLDDSANAVPEGHVGEIFRTRPGVSMATGSCPRRRRKPSGDYLSARRDEEGFYSLVDRKTNLNHFRW
jgi:acyl-coenzyme A synthetase/AMP-(fatty) acid ligase